MMVVCVEKLGLFFVKMKLLINLEKENQII